MIISSHKTLLQKNQNELKINNLKSSKIVSSIFRKFSDKKVFGFQKLNCHQNVSSSTNIVSNYQNRIGNVGNTSQIRKRSFNNLIKSFNFSPKKKYQNNKHTKKENKTNIKRENSNNNILKIKKI